MKKGIIYILMGIFLLFVAENKLTYDVSQTLDYAFSLPTYPSVKHHNEHTDKVSYHHITDFLNAPEESILEPSFSDYFTAIALFASVGFGYFLRMYYTRREKKYFAPANIIYTVRQFIILRSIRL